jgi:orotate phosphoribosyltransferase
MSELKLPSGREFDEVELDVIRSMHKYGTVRYSDKPFNLKAGGTSHVYFMGREDLTMHPKYLAGIAQLAYFHLHGTLAWAGENICLVGVPMAGGAIATAMVIANHLVCEDEQFRFLTMRPVLKTHGANNTWVDGKPEPGEIVALVENVRTTGASEEEALKRLAEDGIPTDNIVRFALVDRKLRPETERMTTLFYMADIITAFGHLGLWSPEQVEKTLPEFLQTE